MRRISGRSRRSRTRSTTCAITSSRCWPGMRVAFETMLAEFDPDRLQEQFDRQLKKGSLLAVPAKLRYWDLYRERCESLLADPDATFRKLFGEEFARAYEEQLERLRAAHRAAPAVAVMADTATLGVVSGIDSASPAERMSAHNKVIWSEGLFLQPQHFQQQDRYLRALRRDALPGAGPAQLGLHRARDRARPAEHRQVRPAPRRRRVSRRHAVPDARRRSAAARRSTSATSVRDQIAAPGRAAAPARRARGRSRDRHRRAWCGTACASSQARDATSSSGDAALLEVGGAAHAPPARQRASPTPTPASRWRTSSSAAPTSRSCSTIRFIPTVLHAARGAAAGDVHDRAARAAAPARRSARRPGRGDRPRRGGGDRRLPDAAGDQPLRAAARALRRRRARASRRTCIGSVSAAAGELATFTTTSKRPPGEVPGVPARPAATSRSSR